MITHSSPQSGIAAHDKYVLTAGYDNKLILWDDEKKVAVAQGVHDHLVNQCSISPCGRYALSSSSDYSIRLWSVPDLKLLRIFNYHSDDVEGVCFHESEPLIASCSRDTSLALFDFNGQLIHQLKGHKKDVISVGWLSGNHRLISSSDDGTIKIWDCNTGEIVKNFDLDDVETDTIAISKEGTIFAGNDLGEILLLVDEDVSKVKAHNAGIKRLVYDRYNGYLVSLSYDRQVKIWKYDLDSGLDCIIDSTLPSIVWPRSCAFLNDSTLVFVTFGNTYASFNLKTRHWSIEHIGDTEGINSVETFNGEMFTVGDSGKVLSEHGKISELGSLCNFIRRSGDLLLAGGQSGEVFNAISEEVYYQHHSPLNCGLFIDNQSEKLFAVGTYTGECLFFNCNDSHATFIRSAQLHSNAIKGIASHGRLLFSVCADNSIALYDCEQDKILGFKRQAHDKIINGCCADVYGRFYSVSRDLTIRRWDKLKLERIIDTPSKHSIKCIAINPEGNLIAIGTYFGYVGLYSVDEDQWVYWHREATAGISSIINSGGAAFIASSYNGELYHVHQN
ncbi:hypothetical protein FKG94_25145 [Exilibacterium tricleocarpae]|uniref:WD40 repeat domain-containing protein n=1 Tax=Exilibacterium tricleocarpae TaxID=2591008 RepID=A0A545SRR9_9GAMM|nr:WD40 repeat domain-containing protein [Exilibacterium tricleocarpae]TQV67663.1 hypothetical protein FKG94_25145 [Exilibacterium tricleocarpae]